MPTRTGILESDQPSGRTARRPQRWAVIAAWAAFLCTVPSAIWRVAMILGWLPGTADLRALHASDPGYVWGLSIVQLTAGALSLGLIQPWGERLGGWRVPRWLPVTIGGLGALAVTWLFTIRMTSQLLGGDRPDQHTVHDGALAGMLAVYLPILAWGPLLMVAVVGYWLRRADESAP